MYSILKDGSLCLGTLDNNGKCQQNKILTVEVKGKVPESGTIVIQKGQIVDKLNTDENKKTQLVINDKTIEIVDGELKYHEEEKEDTEFNKLCELQDGYIENTIGAKYKCNLGDGERFFYILELGNSPVPDSTLKNDEVALILNGNYDETVQAWCDQTGADPSDNACNADGLTGKLDEIAGVWTKLEKSQIGLPSAEQVATADGKVFASGEFSLEKTWLYEWEGNDDYGNDFPYGYWTSTPCVDIIVGDELSKSWAVYSDGFVLKSYVGDITFDPASFGVRPVITLKKEFLVR